MYIILKHALRNISSKKGRTFLLIFCVTLTSFVAMIAFDMTNTIESLMNQYFFQAMGQVDLMVDSTRDDVFDGCENYHEVKFAFAAQLYYDRDPEMYSYSFAKPINVVAFDDYGLAYEFSQLSDNVVIGDNEVYVSSDYSESYDVSEGDVITLYANDGTSFEVTVAGVMSQTQFAFFSGPTIFATPETVKKINCSSNIEYVTRLVALDDYSTAEDFKEQVLKNDPTATIDDMRADMKDADISSLYNMFYLIFLFTFLLVIFVTVSFSEKIVTERMSVVGTFRSLGTTIKTTTMILLLENVLYGLIGAVIGVVAYGFLRVPFLSTFVVLEDDYGNSFDVASMVGATKWYTYALVILGAILVETLTPVFAVVKASKMSIRDIIFANKDTEFKYTWNRAYAGGILFIIAIVASFMNKSFWGLCVSIVAIICSIAILIPFLLKGITILGEKFLKTEKTPVLKLAVKEISNNKTLVNTAVLCITTLILSTSLYTFAGSQRKAFSTIPYDADIVITYLNSNDSFFYSFINDIDGVTEVEIRRGENANITINGEKISDCYVAPWENFTMFTALSQINTELSDNEVIISSQIAANNNIKVGDTVTVVFNNDGFFPIESELVVKDVLNSGITVARDIYISEDRYTDLYGDNPSMLAIRCEEGRAEEVKDLLKKYIVGADDTISTYNELFETNRKQSAPLVATLTTIIVISLGLTIIGVSGNQTIGFENRRREMAVLYSTAMSRRKLIKLILLENAISIGTSVVTALIVSPFLIKIFSRVLTLISSGDIPEITYNVAAVVIYMLVAFLVIMLTNIIPIRRINEMKCSIELKYE